MTNFNESSVRFRTLTIRWMENTRSYGNHITSLDKLRRFVVQHCGVSIGYADQSSTSDLRQILVNQGFEIDVEG